MVSLHAINDKCKAYVYNNISVTCTAPSRNYLGCNFGENSGQLSR